MAKSDLVIGFDADDTHWHTESIFEEVHARYFALLSRYHDASKVESHLFETEMRNLELYGYGIKGFTLSTIETAIDLTHGKISAEEIRELIQLGKEMLAHPVNLIDGAAEALAKLAPDHELILITKGDLLDQERKLAKSGLGDFFHQIEIVSEKDQSTYSEILGRHRVEPRRFLMVGNSVKSDVLPVLELGAFGVHVPYHITWQAERSAVTPEAKGRLFAIKTLHELPDVVMTIEETRRR